MTIDDSRGEKFSKNGNIEANIDGLIDQVIHKSDKSLNILVLGRPGSGKSALDSFIGRYVDPDFSLDNVAFTHDQWSNVCKNRPKKEVSIYSEGRNSYSRLNANSNDFKEAQDIIFQWRFKNHLRLIEFQHLRHFNEELLKEEFHGLIRCFYPESRSKPLCHFYSKGRIGKIKIDNNRKTVSFPDPSWRDSWPDPEEKIPEFWSEYDRVNEEKLKNPEDEEDEDSDLSDDDWLPVGDIADRLGVHEDTIRNWCDDGKMKHGRLPNGDRRIPESEIMRIVEDVKSPEAKG